MAEPTAETPAASDAAVAAGANVAASDFQQKELGIRQLLEAGVHFGHQTRRWNPRMRPYLFGERNGVHIMDLDHTLPRFKAALAFLTETVASGGKVLFVGTKRQAQAPVLLEADRAEQYYVNRRWLGGMLTNFKTVKKSIDRFKELLEIVGDEEKSAERSKKELARINRWIEKYKKSLDGIKQMTRLPDALFVLDVNREAIAVKEASRLGIPIVAVVDSNCDPQKIDYVIPGNDDSIRALQLYCERVADACVEGAAVYNERVQAQVAEEEKVKAAGPQLEKPSTGKVVVEIKQPPRRGRGAAQATGGGRIEEAEKPEKPETPAAPAASAESTPASESKIEESRETGK